MKRSGAIAAILFFLCGLGLASDETSVEATTNDIGQEPEWNCPDPMSTCLFFTGCPVGAFYIGSDALDMAWGTDYTVKPVDADEWFPTEFVVKHPHGLLSPALIYQCSVDQTHKGQSEVRVPPEFGHCATAYQDKDEHIFVMFVSNPLSPCVGWGECICN